MHLFSAIFFFVWCYFSNKVFVLPVLETFGMLEEKIRCVVRRVLCSCYNFPKEEKNFNVYGATNKVHTVLQWSTQVSWGSSWNHQHGFQQDYHLLHYKSLKTSRSFEIILYSVEHNVRKPILHSYLVIYVCVCVCVNIYPHIHIHTHSRWLAMVAWSWPLTSI